MRKADDCHSQTGCVSEERVRSAICIGQTSLFVPRHRIRLISEEVGSERPDASGHLGYLLCEFGSEVVGELAERDGRATKDALDVVVDLAEGPAAHEGEKVCDEVGIIL